KSLDTVVDQAGSDREALIPFGGTRMEGDIWPQTLDVEPKYQPQHHTNGQHRSLATDDLSRHVLHAPRDLAVTSPSPSRSEGEKWRNSGLHPAVLEQGLP